MTGRQPLDAGALGQGTAERKALAQAFGERLRTLRTRRGLTQDEFASRFDVSDVEALEVGRKEPCLADVIALCNGMNVTPNVLLNGFYNRSGPYKRGRRRR